LGCIHLIQRSEKVKDLGELFLKCFQLILGNANTAQCSYVEDFFAAN